MGRRQKQIRFDYVTACKFVLEYKKDLFDKIIGKWNEVMFKNSNPITLEIGCGKGEYTIGMAELFPERNFIGVDIKGSRIYKGILETEKKELKNVAFLRTMVLLIESFFKKGEVEEIWLTFPDPRPLDGDEKRRLFSPRFLALYKSILIDGGILNLKTDNHDLYLYALETIAEMGIKPLIATDDLYNSPFEKDCFGIKTTYEKRYLEEGTKINYLKIQM